MENEIDTSIEDQMYSDDTVLQKELLGKVFDKKNLLNKSMTLKIKGLGKNKWQKDVVLFDFEGEEHKLGISKKNKNELIDILGTSLKNWYGAVVQVIGKEWEGDIDGQHTTGVELVFSKI